MRICIVCSQGGHFTETLQIFEAFEGHEFFLVTHHSSREDEALAIARTYLMRNPGANLLLMMLTSILAIRILLCERPDCIVSLGAEIAVPFFYIGKLLRIKTIFIESWCRIDNLSLTGKLVYPVADHFWVQWPQLLALCGPKAQHWGAVI
jgi:UDP-N-acetylglucosamine:LPS N-acetylglucosamine transferase